MSFQETIRSAFNKIITQDVRVEKFQFTKNQADVELVRRLPLGGVSSRTAFVLYPSFRDNEIGLVLQGHSYIGLSSSLLGADDNVLWFSMKTYELFVPNSQFQDIGHFLKTELVPIITEDTAHLDLHGINPGIVSKDTDKVIIFPNAVFTTANVDGHTRFSQVLARESSQSSVYNIMGMEMLEKVNYDQIRFPYYAHGNNWFLAKHTPVSGDEMRLLDEVLINAGLCVYDAFYKTGYSGQTILTVIYSDAEERLMAFLSEDDLKTTLNGLRVENFTPSNRDNNIFHFDVDIVKNNGKLINLVAGYGLELDRHGKHTASFLATIETNRDKKPVLLNGTATYHRDADLGQMAAPVLLRETTVQGHKIYDLNDMLDEGKKIREFMLSFEDSPSPGMKL